MDRLGSACRNAHQRRLEILSETAGEGEMPAIEDIVHQPPPRFVPQDQRIGPVYSLFTLGVRKPDHHLAALLSRFAARRAERRESLEIRRKNVPLDPRRLVAGKLLRASL